MSKQDDIRTKVFTDLYTAVSKATAESKNAKGEVEKTIFSGLVKDLFKGATVSTFTITRFLWAVSHRTPVLPTVLFRIASHGKQGYEIERLHSGFVSNETGKKIVGVDLVPYIIEAAKLYTTTPRSPKEEKALPVKSAPVTASRDLTALSDDELAALEMALVQEKARRAQERALIAEIQELCELKGVTFEELYGKFMIAKKLMK